jgi:phage baseplate assembly protein W
VQSGISQILNTIPGERRMLPEFGSTFKLLLFDPHDATLYAELGKETAKAIERWEPRVQLERVAITPVDGDDHAVDVFIAWSLVQNNRVASNFTVRVG